jgi:hypothetical protein
MAPLDDMDDPGELPHRRYDVPKLGFENYWYPIIRIAELGCKPKAVRRAGRDIVLFRDAGKLFALDDRCPHRGVKLSLGQCTTLVVARSPARIMAGRSRAAPAAWLPP